MKPRSQAYVLLILALENLKAAKILASSGQVNPRMVGFHLQQAAEKALKAWLDSLGSEYLKTRDLASLLEELEDQNQDVKDFWPLVELTPFAAHLRHQYLEEEEETNLQEMTALVEKLVRRLSGQSGGK
ncbi:MAG: hypothetical protein DRI93_03945 [Aquificota bacterium]|nr:MAG: hypothetical protein DRI93_03945 [Aquificota bacterium]